MFQRKNLVLWLFLNQDQYIFRWYPILDRRTSQIVRNDKMFNFSNTILVLDQKFLVIEFLSNQSLILTFTGTMM